MKTILKVEELKKSYKDTVAVDNLSLEITSGLLTAILGPNGAGKSTTIEMMIGLRKPDSGNLYYFGEPTKKIDRKIKERIGVQLQNTDFFKFLTVEETLKSFASLYEKRSSIMSIMDKFGLTVSAKKPVKSLSGGQKQRLSVACALVNEPEILFFDEPSNHLDPQSRRGMWEEINQLKANGKTIVLTTHQIDEAEKLADYVYIIDMGKVIAQGSVLELTEQGNCSLEDVFLSLTGRSLRD